MENTPRNPSEVQGILASSASNNEVSSTTLLFWLACFAANAVGQPSGRLCGLSFRHRAILRSSPIISFFDAAQILILWVGIACTYPDSSGIRISATRLLRARFVDEDGLPDEKAAVTFQSHSNTRWVLFIITVFPQYLKIFVSTGTSLFPAQVLSAMFLASWLTMELLLAMSDLDAVSEIDRIFPSPWMTKVQTNIQTTAGLSAIVTHTVLYCGCLLFCDFIWFTSTTPTPVSSFDIIIHILDILGLLYVIGVWLKIALGPPCLITVREWLLERLNAAVLVQWWRNVTSGRPLATLAFRLVVISLVPILAYGYIWSKRGGRADLWNNMPYLLVAYEYAPHSRLKGSFITGFCAITVPLVYCFNLYNSAGTFSPGWLSLLG